MHPYTNLPLGTLATEEIRRARQACKAPFVALYKNGQMARTDTYSTLAEHLGIDASECHFALFDVETCRRAEIAIQEMATYTN